MVINLGDLASARELRARIFDQLASHAAYLSFLFIGYSFDDGIFLETLERLIKAIGTPANTYYALFREAPDEEHLYLLNQYGVKVIINDLPDFAKDLSREVRLRDPKDLTLKRIPGTVNIIV